MPNRTMDVRGLHDQANQDWGHHEFIFGFAGHANGWAQRKPNTAGLSLR